MTKTHMHTVARIALVPLGIIVATAAFIQAASGAFPGSVENAVSMHSTLNAHGLTTLTDRRFRTEMSSQTQQTEGQAQQPQGALPALSASLIDLAHSAYAVDPLEASTLRTIALGSLQQEDGERARKVMRLAAQVSKRDEFTNLWLAQDYGRLGEVEAMTASFDHALRTSARAREIAMKPVVDTLASPESHKPLGELLSKHPDWEGAFWREFARNPVALANAAAFFSATGISVDRIPIDDRQLFYASLKAARQFGTLVDLAALDPEAKAGADSLALGKFVTADEGNPLGWTLHSRGTFAASVRGEPGVLEIDARGGTFGVAADRIVRAQGTLNLAVVMAEPVPENARIELAAICPGETAQTLASVSLGPGDETAEASILAANCEYLSVQLSFAIDQGRSDALIRIARIKLSSG